ncbi:MFS transporter [Pseudochryseolinea flava]|uniref:MFS transporter n=1 Tax=Pseudochryseolinea flava TaxID=2059302 RepID=A0A364XZW3_9BACT|nr:MFS transporter [Pseudochryseolinea flava]RAW00072.1 MFS transporter [Pseudochryseolinea flava]
MKKIVFSKYERFVIALIVLVQFTVIADFMVLAPLGMKLMPELNITTAQFGIVVAGYAVSAAISGLLAAGFADRFDRKKILLFFYSGFLIGTLLCGLANSFYFLLSARVVTGIFGGVVGSVVFAIVTDLFAPQVRGRVMGFAQMALGASQILAVPVGLMFGTHEDWKVAGYAMDWHMIFLILVVLGLFVLFMIVKMEPVNAHLSIKTDRKPFDHLLKTLSNKQYVKAFAATTLLATGGFMLMPFGSLFTTINLGIAEELLPWLYLITGVFTMISGPFIGKLADTVGKYPVFCIGSLISATVVVIYANLGPTQLWVLIIINAIMFAGITSRMIASQALMSIIPNPADRGAFMAINSSMQYFAGGIAVSIAGLIVFQKTKTSPVENFDTLSYVVVVTMAITVVMMYFISKQVNQKLGAQGSQPSKTSGEKVVEVAAR